MIFPRCSSVWGGLVFVIYVVLFILHGILVRATQTTDQKYAYSTVIVVLATELLKLIISVVLYWNNHPILHLCQDIRKDLPTLVLYLVPALLYTLYNNLAFVNLSHFDPTTYFLLLQFRVVITGILFQCIFRKWLSVIQWLSLILLTAGCLLKQIEFDWTTAPKVDFSKFFNYRILFILLQACCSCFAGVYNEYLLKKKEAQADIYVQNIFMYVDSVVFNLLALFLIDRQHPLRAFSAESLGQLMDYKILLIIVNMAIVGIITSFFLKKFNSILKVFAGALELICSAILSYLIFEIPVYANTILAIVIVSLAILLYSKNPVKGSKRESNATRGDREPNPLQINSCPQPVDVLDFELQIRPSTSGETFVGTFSK